MYYGIPNLNYTLDFDDELCLLRSCVKVAMDVIGGDDGTTLSRVAARKVADACRMLRNVPHVVTESELAEIAESYGINNFLELLQDEPQPSPDVLLEHTVAAMDASIPPAEVADAYEIITAPEVAPLLRRPRYLMGQELTALCRGGDQKSPVEEFGILRRIAREYVIMYDEALKTRKSPVIVRAMFEVQEAIMDVISVGADAAKILGPLYSQALYLRVGRLGTSRAMPSQGGFDVRWADAVVAMAQLWGYTPQVRGTERLPSQS